MSTWIFNMNVE